MPSDYDDREYEYGQEDDRVSQDPKDPKEIAHPLDDSLGAIHEIALSLARHGEHKLGAALGLAYEAIQNWVIDQDEDREQRDREHAQERDRLRAALAMLYDKWENGDPCFEDPETLDGSLGNAFKLDYEEENEILDLLKDHHKKPALADAEQSK